MILLRLNIKPLLESRGISQKQLAEITGIREATISEMVNNSRTTINKEQLAIVMNALGIEDISEVIQVIKY